MRIEGLSQPVKPTPGSSRGESIRQKKAGAGAGDVVEISRGAPDVAELSAKIAAAPDRMNPRLQEIQARVKLGYYDSQEARRKVADTLLESDPLQGVLSDITQTKAAKQELAKVPDVRREQVDQARQRVADRFYDSTEVRRQTAERMLDELA
jgi:hypothetical protein